MMLPLDHTRSISKPKSEESGAAMLELAAQLYPLCRSITGPGVTRTLELLREVAPLEIISVPTGTPVYDWVVPMEWNVSAAWIEDDSGERLVDFEDHNLHLVSYSVGLDRVVEHEELMQHLHTLPDQPDWIPYRTSYYQPNWGFCARHRDLERFRSKSYRVNIEAEHTHGAMNYGELVIPGQTTREVLFYTHVCHPSLANDNLSGIVVLAHLAKHLLGLSRRRYTYRFLWAPGTIGSIAWLARNESVLARIEHGLVAVLLGRPGPFTYKRTRNGQAEIDRVCAHVLGEGDTLVDFDPYGYDERQFGSPGVNLPVGRLSRAPHGAYPEYHTSADNLDLIDADTLEASLGKLLEIVEILETNRRYLNRSPKGEPQLGKRGLYRQQGGPSLPQRENALLWVLNQSDGEKSLLDVADRSGIPYATIHAAAASLNEAGLLETAPTRNETDGAP